MTDKLNVNGNLHMGSGVVDEFERNSGGDIMPSCEEITVMKTEVKEEWCDFEMSLDNMVFSNVKEEHMSSPEHNLEFMKSTEQALNENHNFGNCDSKGTKLQENKYRCELCHSEFDNEIYLSRHYEQCPFTKKKLTKKGVHLSGDDIDKKYKCAHCTFSTTIKVNFIRHIHVKDKGLHKCTYKDCKCTPEQKDFCECNPCGYEGTSKNILDRHILMKHCAESKKFKCKDCLYTTHWKTNVIQHMRTHSNDKPFKCTYKNCKCAHEQKESCECDICGYAAKQKQTLQKHVLVKHNTESKKYKCRDCKYASYIKGSLLTHMYIHTNENSFKCTYKNCKCKPEQKELCECNPCVFASNNKPHLNRHILTTHCGVPKRYKCKDCKYATDRKRYLIQHKRIHSNDRPYKCTYKNCKCTSEQKESCECDMCGYAAKQEPALRKHILIKHITESKKYKCSDCKYASNIKGDLVQHVRIHTNEKPFKCKYKNCKCTPKEKELCNCNPCGFASRSKTHLNQHILMRHCMEPKNYKCKHCQFATHWKQNLIQHMCIHSNVRPYKCIYKNYKCTHEQNESCECDMCGYAAKQKRTLQKHILLNHSKNQRSKSVVIANIPPITKRI